jgi:cytochrome c-type biogenesis protein CcmH/NrfG
LRASSILAFSYRAGGRVDEAIELAQRVLADLERILGPEHPETLRARMIVAFSYRAAGRLDEAIELGQRVLAESERVLSYAWPSACGFSDSRFASASSSS